MRRVVPSIFILIMSCSLPTVLSAGQPPASTLDGAKPEGTGPTLLMRILQEKGDFAHVIAQSEQPLTIAGFLLACFVGCSSFYGLMMGASGGVRQAISSALKVPSLFLLTLAICLPLLFVASNLMGVHLRFSTLIALMLLPLALTSILLASFAPITAFFSMESDYHFMKLFHVLVFAISGAVGMAALMGGTETLMRQSGLAEQGATLLLPSWILIYGFVGAQMAWRLRPFIGSPGLPFEMFRRSQQQLNFYRAVVLSWKNVGKTEGR